MALMKTLVFDIDGTLAETAGDLIGALNVVLDGEGIGPFRSRRRVRCSARAGAR